MAGEYRKEETLNKLPPAIANLLRGNIRIAKYDGRPIQGCIPRIDLTQSFAAAYHAIGENHYAAGLRNRTMLVVETNGTEATATPNRYYSPGELFFRS